MLSHHRALKGAAVTAAAVLFSLTFAGSARAQTCGSMDVTFVVDETGSMGGVISNIQAQVNKIADEVVKASGGDYQFALVGMPDNNIDVLLNFTPGNRADLATAVAKMATSGGCGGVPYDEAINTVVHSLKARTGSSGAQINDFTSVWRAATKIVIIVTDTLPQGFTCTFTPGVHDVAAHTFAADALKGDIHVTMVYVPTGNTPEATIKAIMQDVTATSGGLFKQAKSDASDLSDIILDIIKACGGAAGGGGSITSLVIEPQEIVLTNGQSGDIHITNLAPPLSGATAFFAEGFDEGEFTSTFKPISKPQAGGTEESTMTITVGPNTFQGTHLVAIRASKGTVRDDFVIVHVIVDCQPPYFLSSGQPQSTTVARGATASLKATPGGDGPLRYQWYRGHSGITTFPIAGATSATLTSDAATTSSEYWVRVSNACGSRDSTTATVNPQ